jgi:hypothetical protein
VLQKEDTLRLRSNQVDTIRSKVRHYESLQQQSRELGISLCVCSGHVTPLIHLIVVSRGGAHLPECGLHFRNVFDVACKSVALQSVAGDFGLNGTTASRHL